MTKRPSIKEFDNEFMCRGQFYVHCDILGPNPKRTIGFGYAPLDGRRQFLTIILEMSEVIGKMTSIDKITYNMYALLIYYISDNGETWCRGVPVPCTTSGPEFIFTLVKEHLPNRELTDSMFSLGMPEKINGLDLDQLERVFLMRLGKDRVDSGQDFETSGGDLSGINKMLESYFAKQSEERANLKKDVIKAMTGWNSPKTETTQKTRAKFYDVSVQTIKRWEKPPFKGRPDYYDREASMEDQKKHGEQYMRDHRLNKYARENRKRKRMD